MTVLALDLGTHLGWALRRPSGEIASGTQSFALAGHEREGMRFIKFRAWLHEKKSMCDARHEPLTLLRYERKDFMVPRQVVATRISFGLWAHLVGWAEHHGIEYEGVAVGTIKKAITGRGDAKKREVIHAVRMRGFSVYNDDEADALALLLMDQPAKARAA